LAPTTSSQQLSYFENGMPRFSTIDMFGGPKDYASALTADKIGVEPSFSALREHFRNTPNLWKRLISSRMEEGKDQKEFLDIETRLFVGYLTDRYIHIYNTHDFSVSNLLPLYLPLEAERIQENLAVDLWVPVLFVKFKTDEFRFDERTSLRRISEKMHLARAEQRNYGLAIHDLVMGAATHSFVLTGFNVPNSEYGEWQNTTSTASAYPMSSVDLLFSVLRLVTGLDTGYAQLLLEPQGWAHNYRSDLPYLTGTSVRKYPPLFEDYYWNRTTVPEITEISLKEIGDSYRQINKLSDIKAKNRILLATKRLNDCLLRENEEDSILDIASALEALLTPGDNTEITHKLATRLAALAKFAKTSEPASVVFRNVKKIYAHRSNVAHGNVEKLKKSRDIRISDTESVPAVKFATDYLRLALRILIQFPQYLEPNRIDEELVVG
jgi:hypothetical protein